MTMEDRIDEFCEGHEEALKGCSKGRITSQHDKGKMTVRKRIDYFLDDNTSREFDQFRTHRNHKFGMEETKLLDDGVITSYGEVGGRAIFISTRDLTVFGGSFGKVFTEKVYKVMDKAMEVGAPTVSLNDPVGARIQKDAQSLGGFGEILRRNTKAPGVIPQVSAIIGPYAGGAVYSPALTDFTFMIHDTSYMLITGPDVIKTVTGEKITFDELGGATTHTSTSEVAHFVTDIEEQALDDTHRLLSYLPQNNVEDPPRVEPWDDPKRIDGDPAGVVSGQPRKFYDIHGVLDGALDEGSFFGVQEDFAKNIVVGFGRLDGHLIGIIANQPRANAGVFNVNALKEGACFIRFRDSFNIPIPTFVDVPGFLPGTNQEHNSTIRHGVKLLHAYSEVTMPLMTVITRKAYGDVYDVMASKRSDANVDYAQPTAEIVVMGPQGMVNIPHRDELDAADDPDTRHDELIEEYRKGSADPYTTMNRGFIDDVTGSGEARERPISDLRMLNSKRKSQPDRKHGSTPL